MPEFLYNGFCEEEDREREGMGMHCCHGVGGLAIGTVGVVLLRCTFLGIDNGLCREEDREA
ncbi:tRNA-splicing endonuclease subunit Sen34 [Sesbania bispinosa]|nr:tRNA-splicing endonuclease subunit Sen34 [Sesbania bispinosa]